MVRNIQGKIQIPAIILIGAMSAFVPLVFMVIVFKITFGDPHSI
jgi:hypothetical protein